MNNATAEEIKKLVAFKAREAHRFLPEEELEDLIQIGYEVAIKAYRRYDEKTETMFTTFLFPYLSRYYLGLYAKNRCTKKSFKKQKMADSQWMEEHPPIFPRSYVLGTTYFLDRPVGDDVKYQPILSEKSLQSPTPYDEYAAKETIVRLFNELDVTSQKVLKLLLFPPEEKPSKMVAEHKEKKNNNYFCKKLGITSYQYSQSLLNIRKGFKKLKTIL